MPFRYQTILPPHLKELEQYSTAPTNNPVTDTGATLGRVLFYDRALSRNGLVSCASCHSQETGFDDPNRLSIGLEGKLTRRHSVGLDFAGYNATGQYFRDEHAQTLEEQVLEPIHDALEMGLPIDKLITRIKARKWYKPLFKAAFGKTEITRTQIAKALAQFVRTIVGTQSLYDLARADVKSATTPFPAFSTIENRGKFLFMAPRNQNGFSCISCHETEAFIMLKRHNNGLDAEPENTLLRGASLRNITIRAPYMHDGRFQTLDEVIEHYSMDIRNNPELGEPLKDEKGNPLRFNITEEDKTALIAFLKTLTDETLLTDRKFSNPFF